MSKTVTKIGKRNNVNPERNKKEYGDVEFADPTNNKYPLDSDQAEAHFNNGVLEVTMPMPEQKSKGRSLEIGEGNKPTKQNNKKVSGQ